MYFSVCKYSFTLYLLPCKDAFQCPLQLINIILYVRQCCEYFSDAIIKKDMFVCCLCTGEASHYTVKLIPTLLPITIFVIGSKMVITLSILLFLSQLQWYSMSVELFLAMKPEYCCVCHHWICYIFYFIYVLYCIWPEEGTKHVFHSDINGSFRINWQIHSTFSL